MQTLLARLTVIATMILVAGCAGGPQVKKEAFAKPQKLAIVTISGSAHGIYTSDDEDAKILADAVPACLNELAKSHNIRLLPATAASTSKAYASIKDDGAMITMQLLPGYKRFTPENEKKNLHALAKELHVDGFLILYLNYGEVAGTTVGIGFLSIGSKKPSVSYAVAAVNSDGESIWQDNIQIVGDDGIAAVNGIGNYSYLISKLKGLTQTACQQSVKNLADQIAAK